jgi:hypothetical protein
MLPPKIIPPRARQRKAGQTGQTPRERPDFLAEATRCLDIDVVV